MIWDARGAQHDAVEPVVIFETIEDAQAKAGAVERQQRVDIIARACDAQDGCVLHAARLSAAA